MKTYDKQKIKEKRVYYRILSYTYKGNSLIPSPSVTRVKCEKVYPKGNKFFEIECARFIPGCILKPCEANKQIFHNFNEAKRICLKRAKAIKRNVDQAVQKLESLTKKELKNEQ